MSTSLAPSSRARLTTAALALVLFGTGCSRSKEAPASTSAPAPMVAASAAAPAAEAQAPGGGAVAKPAAASRALVVTIEMSMTAKNPDVVAARLRDEVERAGGFVADASSSGSGDSRTARLVLRVPGERTKSLRAAMADLGHIVSDSEKTEDVTEARADLEARLTNARAQEKRLLEIMSHRTGGVSEVLEVERELARVRETIERFDAQKRALDGKIDLATVTVTINTPTAVPAPAVEETAPQKIAGAFKEGVHATGVLLLWGAMAFAATSPVLVPLAGLVTLVVFLARRRRRAQLAAMHAMMQGIPGPKTAG